MEKRYWDEVYIGMGGGYIICFGTHAMFTHERNVPKRVAPTTNALINNAKAEEARLSAQLCGLGVVNVGIESLPTPCEPLDCRNDIMVCDGIIICDEIDTCKELTICDEINDFQSIESQKTLAERQVAMVEVHNDEIDHVQLRKEEIWDAKADIKNVTSVADVANFWGRDKPPIPIFISNAKINRVSEFLCGERMNRIIAVNGVKFTFKTKVKMPSHYIFREVEAFPEDAAEVALNFTVYDKATLKRSMDQLFITSGGIEQMYMNHTLDIEILRPVISEFCNFNVIDTAGVFRYYGARRWVLKDGNKYWMLDSIDDKKEMMMIFLARGNDWKEQLSVWWDEECEPAFSSMQPFRKDINLLSNMSGLDSGKLMVSDVRPLLRYFPSRCFSSDFLLACRGVVDTFTVDERKLVIRPDESIATWLRRNNLSNMFSIISPELFMEIFRSSGVMPEINPNELKKDFIKKLGGRTVLMDFPVEMCKFLTIDSPMIKDMIPILLDLVDRLQDINELMLLTPDEAKKYIIDTVVKNHDGVKKDKFSIAIEKAKNIVELEKKELDENQLRAKRERNAIKNAKKEEKKEDAEIWKKMDFTSVPIRPDIMNDLPSMTNPYNAPPSHIIEPYDCVPNGPNDNPPNNPDGNEPIKNAISDLGPYTKKLLFPSGYFLIDKKRKHSSIREIKDFTNAWLNIKNRCLNWLRFILGLKIDLHDYSIFRSKWEVKGNWARFLDTHQVDVSDDSADVRDVRYSSQKLKQTNLTFWHTTVEVISEWFIDGGALIGPTNIIHPGPYRNVHEKHYFIPEVVASLLSTGIQFTIYDDETTFNAMTALIARNFANYNIRPEENYLLSGSYRVAQLLLIANAAGVVTTNFHSARSVIK
jgi:hypothetical protein